MTHDPLTRAAVQRAQSALQIIASIQNIHRFSFARLIDGIVSDRLTGYEAEVLQQTARRAGKSFDLQRVHVPWGLFQRDLSAASASSGGYLAGVDNLDPLDVLRPYSVTAQAGITSLPDLSGDLTIPRTATKAAVTWLSSETQPIAGSTPATGQIGLAPKTAGALVDLSRLFARQTQSEAFLRRELLRTAASAVDQAVLNGSGALGEPTGLLNTSGVGVQSGSSLAYTGVLEMKGAVASANAPDDQISWIGTPGVRELLEGRERAAGSGFIWDADRVAARSARVSTDLPGATLICGAWSEAILGIWGDGFEFHLNPYDSSAFRAGIIQARVLVSIDVAIAHADAFSAASSIT